MKARPTFITTTTPLFNQIEAVMFLIVALTFLVAIGASTFIILVLSKVLDMLPFGPGGEQLRETARTGDDE